MMIGLLCLFVWHKKTVIDVFHLSNFWKSSGQQVSDSKWSTPKIHIPIIKLRRKIHL